MENTLFVALSKQLAIRRQMDIIANNLANADTNGFKTERMMFAELLSERLPEERRLSFVHDVATAMDLREGGMQATGNPLDVALKGPGWFSVDTPQGVRYTRDGQFRLNDEGFLVTKQGHPVLSTQDQPIAFTPADGQIEIKGDGTVSAGGQDRGRIAVVSFDNPQMLEKASGNLYRTDAPAIPTEETHLVQGTIEDSNVLPVIEVTRMITALRTYQGAQNLINKEDERQRLAIRKLTAEP
jgi:flagellar basal-body rod protein FlgF